MQQKIDEPELLKDCGRVEMWRRTTWSVAGDQRHAVLKAVQLYLEGERRFGNIEWIEPHRVIAALPSTTFQRAAKECRCPSAEG
jgi:hypothetical protein